MIKNRLKVLVVERDMSLKQLAERLEMHYTTINRFARDDQKLVSKEILEAICRELGVQPGDVFIYRPDVAEKQPSKGGGRRDDKEDSDGRQA